MRMQGLTLKQVINQATSRSAGYHKVIPQEVIPVSNTVARLSSDLFQGDDQALKDTAAAKEGR